MEQPPQNTSSKPYDVPIFKTLPPDLKTHLFSYLFTGSLQGMSRGLYNLATLDKEHHKLVNDPQRIIALLESLPRVCNAISLVEKLRSKKISLPGMQNSLVEEWFWNTDKIRLTKGTELVCTALENNKEKCAALLREKNVDLHFNDRSTASPLSTAARGGHIEIMRLLLAAGADPDMKSFIKNNKAVLMEAADVGSPDVIRLLLANGASINQENSFGKTALAFAIEKRRTEAVKILLAAGARSGSGEYSGNWAIDYAKRYEYHEIVALLEQEKEKRKDASYGKQAWCEIL